MKNWATISILIVVSIFFLTSPTNAGLSLTIGPEAEGVIAGAEYTIAPGQTVWIGVDNQDILQFDVIILINDDPCSLANGSWTGGNNTYCE